MKYVLPKSLGAPALRALQAAGYRDQHQLDGVPADDLLALHGVGPRAILILAEELSLHGWALH